MLQEDLLANTEEGNRADLMDRFRSEDMERNRQRVNEIYTLVNVINKQELDEHMIDDEAH